MWIPRRAESHITFGIDHHPADDSVPRPAEDLSNSLWQFGDFRRDDDCADAAITCLRASGFIERSRAKGNRTPDLRTARARPPEPAITAHRFTPAARAHPPGRAIAVHRLIPLALAHPPGRAITVHKVTQAAPAHPPRRIAVTHRRSAPRNERPRPTPRFHDPALPQRIQRLRRRRPRHRPPHRQLAFGLHFVAHPEFAPLDPPPDVLGDAQVFRQRCIGLGHSWRV